MPSPKPCPPKTVRVFEIENWAFPGAADDLRDMRRRLERTRLPDSVCPGWSGGVDTGFLRRFIHYLVHDYSWANDTLRFAGRHLMIRVPAGEDGENVRVHVHLPLEEIAGAMPVVFLHGWPSSGLEFVHVSGYLRGTPLAPVIVDLPGFGFSTPTASPAGPRQIALILKQVIRDVLGLRNIVVHGNDWGSTIACWLAADHPELVCGIHLSTLGLKPAPDDHAAPWSAEEIEWFKTVRTRLRADAGYREIQSTKPNTAAIGLADSPGALAAWFVEKFHDWSGAGPTEDPPIAIEDIAAIVTSYWISNNAASANWIYKAVRDHDDTTAPAGGTGRTPVGLSLFGSGFFPVPPRSWAQRMHNVLRFCSHPSGGHYPALTRPDVLARDLADFCEAIR